MKYNKVAPWEGRLKWVGTPRTGTSRNGNDWKQVDFTLEYADEDKVKHITFSLFGAERVDKLIAVPVGSLVRVRWVPDSREFNGKWWPSFSAYEIEAVNESQTAEPNTQTSQPAPKAEKVNPQEEDEDLPF